MQNINIGDVVTRKSYGSDILFKVVDKKEVDSTTNYILKGICYRLEADALESDLLLQPKNKISEYTRNMLVQADKKNIELKMAGRYKRHPIT